MTKVLYLTAFFFSLLFFYGMTVLAFWLLKANTTYLVVYMGPIFIAITMIYAVMEEFKH